MKELCPFFDAMYSTMGSPSIPPERLLEHKIAIRFFDKVVQYARKEGLLSNAHFTVDGSLIEACASMKSFRPKGESPSDRSTTDDDKGNPTTNSRGEKRSNETHCATTDPEAMLMRKAWGKEAKLSYSAHALMENRNGFLVELKIAQAWTRAERQTALGMIGRQGRKRIRLKTLGTDKGYDSMDFMKRLREKEIVPHIAANTGRRGGFAIDGRTTRHMGYSISQRARKRVEEIFGWFKTIGGFRRTRFRGRDRTELQALFVGTAYNLIRMARILGKKMAVI